MSDTCIVCLGDLSIGTDGVAAQSLTSAKSPNHDFTSGASDPDTAPATTQAEKGAVEGPELIAHLLPCGHELHDACLKPWVERANSCPICRASFHEVQLMHFIGGDAISSYAVEDRTQVAEIDPTLFLEAPDDDDDQPCQECNENDNEDVLMICDGCAKMWHTYCVGLADVPWGSWYCENCRETQQFDPTPTLHPRSAREASRRRTRGTRRRRRNRQSPYDEGWNQVWQSVWSRLNLDLDFPNEDDEEEEEETPANFMRRHRQSIANHRREHEAWERRMQVAELAGAGRRFRETEATLLNGDGTGSRRRTSPAPIEETPEQVAAWDAFAQARAVSAEPSSSRKRRRVPTMSSPVEAQPESPPRVVKRRRVSSSRTRPAEASHATAAVVEPRPISPAPRRPPVGESATPSFLQSLLQEVEDSSAPYNNWPSHRPSPRYAGSATADQQSPRPSSPGLSPALSPVPSNHSSPRASSATPPPTTNGYRSSSPSGLTSRIQPIFYSPQRLTSPEPRPKRPESPPAKASGSRHTASTSAPAPAPVMTRIAQPKPRRPRIPANAISNAVQSQPHDGSPTRPSLTANNKADVQRLVSAALKPHYHEQKISKDEYTNINRDVSRMLYDKIGDFETLDVESRAKWEKVAGDEVNKAVTALRA